MTALDNAIREAVHGSPERPHGIMATSRLKVRIKEHVLPVIEAKEKELATLQEQYDTVAQGFDAAAATCKRTLLRSKELAEKRDSCVERILEVVNAARLGAEGLIAVEKFAGNIVKEEHWKGEVAAFRYVEVIVTECFGMIQAEIQDRTEPKPPDDRPATIERPCDDRPTTTSESSTLE